MALAELPLRTFLDQPLVPYETDEVTRLICDTHDAAAFAPVAALTVGELKPGVTFSASGSFARGMLYSSSE